MDVRRASKRLAWLLRHGASEVGLSMDPAGWADVSDVLTIVNIPADTLEQVVRDNNKARFSWSKDAFGRHRATRAAVFR